MRGVDAASAMQDPMKGEWLIRRHRFEFLSGIRRKGPGIRLRDLSHNSGL